MTGAIDIARAHLAAAGFNDLAQETSGDAATVVRPARALTQEEAVAFVRIRRHAYLTVGLVPCECDGDDRCPNLDADGQPRCFEDSEAWHAHTLRLLQQPASERPH